MTGATIRGDGRDPVPGALRRMLALGRLRGLSFQRAWMEALEATPIPPAWTERQAGGLAGDDVSPLDFAKHVFARAYARIPLGGDVTAFSDDDRPKAGTPKPEVCAPPKRCSWGRPVCGANPVGDGRFCATHAARLAHIRDGLEQSDMANSKQAMPRRIGRRLDSLPTFDLDLLGARAAVLG